MTSNNEIRIKQLEEQLAQALYINRAVVKTAMAKAADDAATIAVLHARIAVLEAKTPTIVEKIIVKTVEVESTASLEAIACLNAALGQAASALVAKEVEVKSARTAAAALATGITNLTAKFNQASSSLASAEAKIATLKGRHAAEMKAATASQARLVNELAAAKAALADRPALAVDKVDSGVEIGETPSTSTTVSVPVVSAPVLPASKELDALRTAFLTATSKADKAICHDALASALIDGFCSTTTTTTTTTTASTTTAIISDTEATLTQELAEANRALGIAKGLILTLKSRLPASV